MQVKLIGAAAAAISISLATAAWSTSTGTAPRSSTGHVRVKPPHAHRAALPGALGRSFGTGCGTLPRIGGEGTRRGLPSLPVATAIARIPLLSDLSRAIRLAGLTRMLNAAPALTVFAPDNAAFRELGSGNLQALFTTRSDLVPVLKFQIVAGRVRAVELARERVLTTIAGTRIYPARAAPSAPSYYVNNALITCGNLRAANATVYIVNRVVMPAT